MAEGIAVEIAGITYRSITRACKVLGVTKSVLYKTAEKLNVQPIEMVEYYIEHKKLPSIEAPAIVVRGIPFNSIQEICDHFELVASTANDMRKRKKWSWEQTITYYEQKRAGNIAPVGQVTVKDKVFPSIQKACDYYGFSLSAVKNLAYYDYLSMKEALEMYIDGEYPLFPNRAQVGAVEYPTAKAALEAVSLYSTWSMRLMPERGLTCEEVITQRLPRAIKQFWADELALFKPYKILWQDIHEQMILTGIDPKKLWVYYTKHKRFPCVNADESYYIQFHTFPSIELACLHFDLDFADVAKLHGEFSWNGAFTHLLK